jgi:lipoate-protein ligase A
VAGDVVTGSRKLAGGAQRRSRTGVLHQGSIAARVPAARLVAGFQQEFSLEFIPYQLTLSEQELAAQLAREKYSGAGWNEHSARKLTHVH